MIAELSKPPPEIVNEFEEFTGIIENNADSLKLLNGAYSELEYLVHKVYDLIQM
jgi:hypothetical protein